MNRRDLFIMLCGGLLVVIGLGAIMYGNTTVPFIAMFLLMALLLTVLVLQRRQLAAVQERTLRLLQSQKASSSQLKSVQKLLTSSEKKDDIHISTKKVISLLNAQQISMELLAKKLEKIGSKSEHE